MQTKPVHTEAKQETRTIQTNEKAVPTIELSEKTETKSIEKYGFKFEVPKTWQPDLTDFKAVDLQGKVKTLTTSFVDTLSGARIQLVYHPGKAGKTLYDYYRKQKTEKIKIAGQEAVKISKVLKIDGKGHALKTPLIREKIILMTPGQSGSLELILDAKQQDQKTHSLWQNFLQNMVALK